jgi:RHS repeat-associated protein
VNEFLYIFWLVLAAWPTLADFPSSHARIEDGLGRLVGVVERDNATNGFNWSAIYDASGRRLRTVNVPVTNGVTNLGSTLTVDSYYDPQVKYAEVAVGVNGQRTWKVLGPDINGRYGGMHGVGGLEATVLETDGTIVPVLNDYFGNVLATISAATVTWNPIRVGAYGPVMGYRPATVAPGTALAETLVWRSRWMDPSGFYCLGARYYDPMAGHFLSPDPLGHAASMDLYSVCNGDPLNRFDPEGKLGRGTYLAFDFDSGTATQVNAYDIYYLGWERALAGESIANNFLAVNSTPWTDQPTESLNGQSIRMVFGDVGTAFIVAAVMFNPGVATLGSLAGVAYSSQDAGTASVGGSASDRAWAYTGLGFSVAVAGFSLWAPLSGISAAGTTATSESVTIGGARDCIACTAEQLAAVLGVEAEPLRLQQLFDLVNSQNVATWQDAVRMIEAYTGLRAGEPVAWESAGPGQYAVFTPGHVDYGFVPVDNPNISSYIFDSQQANPERGVVFPGTVPQFKGAIAVPFTRPF